MKLFLPYEFKKRLASEQGINDFIEALKLKALLVDEGVDLTVDEVRGLFDSIEPHPDQAIGGMSILAPDAESKPEDQVVK